jgi:hypothetical protein
MSIIDLSALIVERLRADAVAVEVFRQISYAGELAEARRAMRAPPAVFVFPLAETTGEPLFAGNFRQTRTLRMAVLLVTADGRRGVAGGGGFSGIAPARSAVEEALIGEAGWMPPGCSDVLAWAGGRVIGIDDIGYLWWQDEYATRQIVKTPV